MTGRTKETNDGRQLYWRLWCGDGNIILVVVTTLLEGRYSSSTTITITAAKYSLLDEWDGNMATNGLMVVMVVMVESGRMLS